jgi:hypothetical protein
MTKYKIFYNPVNMKIRGMSDEDCSMEYPFVETTTYYHSLGNLAVELDKKGKPKLLVVKGYMDEDDIKNL